MNDAVIWNEEGVAPWWCVSMVGSSDLDLDIVVENGDETTLKTVDVCHVGISNKFGGSTIS